VKKGYKRSVDNQEKTYGPKTDIGFFSTILYNHWAF